MAANTESVNRQVVPRWRPFREAVARNELASGTTAEKKAVDGTEFLEEKEIAWAVEMAGF